MDSPLSIAEEWVKGVKDDLIANYDKLGLRASGKFAQSLESIVTERPNGYNIKIRAAKHSYFMENGRRPNKEKSPEQAKVLYPIIKQWIADKGLGFDDRRAFAIALKIVYEGIKVPNKHNPGGVISDVITEERTRELIRKLAIDKINTFRSDVLKELKK